MYQIIRGNETKDGRIAFYFYVFKKSIAINIVCTKINRIEISNYIQK